MQPSDDRPEGGRDDQLACLALLDSGLRIIEVNNDLTRLLGVDAESLRGQSFYSIVDERFHRTLRPEFARLLRGERDRFVSPIAGGIPGGRPVRVDLTATLARGPRRIGASIMLLLTTESSQVGDTDVTPTPAPTGLRLSPEITLSAMDARILEGIAVGASTASLATRLFLSRQGIEYHVSSMLRRLQVPNRAALVSKAYALGVLRNGVWPPTTGVDTPADPDERRPFSA